MRRGRTSPVPKPPVKHETSRDAVYWTSLHESVVSHEFEHDFEQHICGDASLTSGDQRSEAIPVQEHDDDEFTLQNRYCFIK